MLERDWLFGHPDEYDDGYEDWLKEVGKFLSEHNIRWIFVSGKKLLTDYGNNCYGVLLSEKQDGILTVIDDVGVDDVAWAYLYDGNRFTPEVVEISD